jgi:hypothetical protein
MLDNLENLVRILAYELWETAGRPPGRDEHFWFSAESQIKQALAEPAAADALAAEAAQDIPAEDPVAAAASANGTGAKAPA